MERLKIRKKVDLNKLKDYGFNHIETDEGNSWFKKVYMQNDDDDRVCYRINEDDRIIQITRLDGELDSTLFKLVSDKLVEIDFKKNKSIRW